MAQAASRLIDRPRELDRSVCATASSAWLKTTRAATTSGLFARFES